MSTVGQTLKLTAHFAERERVGDRFLAEALLDLFAERRIATSIMLRGIASFGPRHVVRSDASLSLSEDLPVLVSAVDTAPAIEAVVDDVVGLTHRGLLTVERARPVTGETQAAEHIVKLSLYLGRRQHLNGQPGHQAACEMFHRLGFLSATAFLGVDGTVSGERRRARFFSRNVDVPMVVTAIGTPGQAALASAELSTMLPDPLLTMERIQVCKRDGRLLEAPRMPAPDPAAPTYLKLTVLSAEDSRHGGVPIHRALVRRLWDDGQVGGATAVRGLWGFHGDHAPHGDALFQLGRRVPVATIVVDTPERIARSFALVDELTLEHGLVTCETVPAMVAVDGDGRRGTTRLTGG